MLREKKQRQRRQRQQQRPTPQSEMDAAAAPLAVSAQPRTRFRPMRCSTWESVEGTTDTTARRMSEAPAAATCRPDADRPTDVLVRWMSDRRECRSRRSCRASIDSSSRMIGITRGRGRRRPDLRHRVNSGNREFACYSAESKYIGFPFSTALAL